MVARLAALCLVELAIVVWLAVQVFAAAPPAPPPANGNAPPPAPAHAPVPAAHDAAAGTAAATNRPAAGADADAAPARQRVAEPWDPADPAGVLLTGTLRWRDDGGGAADVTVWATRDKTNASCTSAADGGYALVGLSPGEWTLRLRGEGVVDQEAKLTIGDEAVQQHDLALDRSFPIRVRIVTPTGEDATMAVRTAMSFAFADFFVAGQREPFPQRFAPTDYGAVFVGDATWRGEMNPKDGFTGTLHLAGAPPCHVALLQRHLVLQQQVVQPGQTEVTFVVDVDALRGLAGSASLRVVDAATGQPIPGARVSMNTSNRGGIGQPTAADGRIVLENLSPGLLRCQVAATDKETMYTTVRVEPGQRLDLGDVRPGAALPLRGTVVDAEGKPVGGANLRWTEHKWMGTARPFASNRGTVSDADGTFQLAGTGAGTITVTASIGQGGERRLAYGVFENPPAEPVVLRLASPASCTVAAPRDPTRAFDLLLFDAGKRPVAGFVLDHRLAERAIEMPPGDYGYEVRENGTIVQSGTLRMHGEPARLEVR